MSKRAEHRCPWALDHPTFLAYHDEEWGAPVLKDTRLFELLILEGAQAGLSWSTILQKREGYRRLFAGFSPVEVARFKREDVDRLVEDPSIVRSRRKIEAAVSNAKVFVEIQAEFGSFYAFQMRFVGGRPIPGNWKREDDIPTSTAASSVFSRDLKQRGAKFFGSTTAYAYMQAVGMVNDHITSCFRYAELMRMENLKPS